jgi:putative ABC transport system permease protein
MTALWLDRLSQDLRSALRGLRLRPGINLVAITTLALGIGATTAIFSVVEGILLKPFPFADTGRLVMVWEDLTREGNHRFSVAPPNYRDIRDQTTSFSGVAAQLGIGMHVRLGDTPELVRGAKVSANFFSVLGARAAEGAALSTDTLAPDRRVVVISHRFRMSHFGAASPVGGKLTIDGAPYTIVGVMPGGFSAPSFFKAPHQHADLWTPLELPPQWDTRDAATLQVVARLGAGVTPARAAADVRGLAARLAQSYPETNKDVGLVLVPLEEQLLGALRPSLLLLLGAVSLLLLIAAANVANLFLARALARQDEVGVRLALGAPRSAIVRLFLTESMTVAVVGGALGMLVAWFGTRVLIAFAPPDTIRLEQVHVDGAVLAFALGVTLLVGLGFGSIPALQGARFGSAGFRAGPRSPTSGRRAVALRHMLVVGQLAMAVMLLAGAGLMVRTLAGLARVDPGFDVGDLITLRFGMLDTKYPTPERQVRYLADLMAAMERVPGVTSVAFSSRLPLDPSYGVAQVRIQGRPVPASDLPVVGARVVSDRYFSTMRIPVVRGRDFTAHDDAANTPVAMVNRVMAQRLWPNANPIGEHIDLGSTGQDWREVIGIAGDVSHDGIAAAPIAELYIPYAQSPADGGALVVRTSVEPSAALDQGLRRAALSVDPDQALIDIGTMRQTADGSIAPRRFSMLLLVAFAAFALLLTTVGVFGVLSYGVGRRTREIGVRLALGAPERGVLLLVLRQGAALIAAGLCIGLAGAFAFTRLLSSQLYQVSPRDPMAFTAAVLLIATVAFAATWLPARRATRIDPASALRAE